MTHRHCDVLFFFLLRFNVLSLDFCLVLETLDWFDGFLNIPWYMAAHQIRLLIIILMTFQSKVYSNTGKILKVLSIYQAMLIKFLIFVKNG